MLMFYVSLFFYFIFFLLAFNMMDLSVFKCFYQIQIFNKKNNLKSYMYFTVSLDTLFFFYLFYEHMFLEILFWTAPSNILIYMHDKSYIYYTCFIGYSFFFLHFFSTFFCFSTFFFLHFFFILHFFLKHIQRTTSSSCSIT